MEYPILRTGTYIYGINILDEPTLFRDWFDIKLIYKEKRYVSPLQEYVQSEDWRYYNTGGRWWWNCLPVSEEVNSILDQLHA